VRVSASRAFRPTHEYSGSGSAVEPAGGEETRIRAEHFKGLVHQHREGGIAPSLPFHRVEAREAKKAVNTADCGRMRLSACPLERWLGDENSSSASRLRAARCGEIRGEIWGDLPLLGRRAEGARPSVHKDWQPRAVGRRAGAPSAMQRGARVGRVAAAARVQDGRVRVGRRKDELGVWERLAEGARLSGSGAGAG